MNAASAYVLALLADGHVIVSGRMDGPWRDLVLADIAAGALPAMQTGGLAPTDTAGHIVLVDATGREWPANLPVLQ